MDVNEFWKPYETEIDSFDAAMKLIHEVFEEWSGKGSVFAWRGQVDASWALHSSLYRRLLWTRGVASAAEEADLQKEEGEILAEAHRWGLHVNAERGRLSVLAQLAMLQHFGSPTRLLDVTFNPLIGLWFAVEQQWDNGVEKSDATDGRLFVVDVSTRVINEDDDRRGWEDDFRRPWPRPEDAAPYREWMTKPLAWRAARFDQRIAAQNGGFLLGGVPASPGQWLKDSAKSGDYWSIDEVRKVLSVPLHFHKIEAKEGRDPNNPAYTVRIKADAKPEIRRRLQELYGYRHATIYPDYPGFALYGRPGLKSRP